MKTRKPNSGKSGDILSGGKPAVSVGIDNKNTNYNQVTRKPLSKLISVSKAAQSNVHDNLHTGKLIRNE